MPAVDQVRLTPAAAQAAPTWRAAYSDRTAALMAAFAELAYLPFETAVGYAQLRAALGAGLFRLVGAFDSADTQAYLAVSAEFAVLAFRGTTDLRDWETNADVRRRILRPPAPLSADRWRLARAAAPPVAVHEGFLEAYTACGSMIAKAVGTLPPDLGLYITGHSLGGALAQIASALLERDTLAACYTFGSPRVGAADFDELVKCPHYRVVNDWDLVPGVPLESPWGYQHGGDPRLLAGPTPAAILRRDRNPVARILVDLFAAAIALATRGLFVVADHMIWNYRAKLEAIAAARNNTG